MVALLHPKRAGTIRFLRELQEGGHLNDRLDNSARTARMQLARPDEGIAGVGKALVAPCFPPIRVVDNRILDVPVPNMGQWQSMEAARNGGDDGKAHDEKGICDDSVHSRGRNGTRLQCLERRQIHVDLDARR